jgi:hypothetical protein
LINFILQQKDLLLGFGWMDGQTSLRDVREEFVKLFLLIIFFPLDFFILQLYNLFIFGLGK